MKVHLVDCVIFVVALVGIASVVLLEKSSSTSQRSTATGENCLFLVWNLSKMETFQVYILSNAFVDADAVQHDIHKSGPYQQQIQHYGSFTPN